MIRILIIKIAIEYNAFVFTIHSWILDPNFCFNWYSIKLCLNLTTVINVWQVKKEKKTKTINCIMYYINTINYFIKSVCVNSIYVCNKGLQLYVYL